MKKMKKLLTVTLMVAMVCGMFAVVEPEKAEAAMPTTEYFNETFSTDGAFDNEELTSNSNENLGIWKTYVTGGKFVIPSAHEKSLYLMVNDEEWMEKSDYEVSCKVQFSNVPTIPTANIGLVARTTNANSAGYEFQLTLEYDSVTEESSAFVRLRDRTAGYFTGKYYPVDFDCTEENIFKIKCKGNNIVCFVNDEECINYTISENNRYAGWKEGDEDVYTNVFSSGTAAFRMVSNDIGATVSVDDFNVYYIDDHKFCDDFNGYDGDATNAQKRATLLENDWWVRTNGIAGMLTGESFVVSADYDVNPIVLQTETAKGALGWNDYSVEADVTIGTSEQTLTSDVYACVTGRHTEVGGNNGYEIQLYCKTDGTKKLRIYGRNAGSTLAQCDFPLEYGRAYNLKAVFQGNTIYAYVDNVLYLTVTDDTYPIGFAGIRKNGTNGTACGMDVKFDNFVVYDYDVQPTVFEEDFQSYENNTSGDANQLAMRERGWNALTQWTGNCNTGTNFKVPSNRAVNLALTRLDGAADWQNCIVECDLDFTTLSETAGAQRKVYIACRETADDAGYGFAVETSKSNQIRYIYLVKNGVKLTTTGAALELASAQRINFGEMITLRLEVRDRTITGYVVGQETTTTVEYTIPDSEEITCGYAGIHTSSTSSTTYEAIIDNFKVYDLDNPYVKEIVGDIDDSKVVDATDTGVLKDSLLAETLDNEALDVNKNDVINIYDYVRMKRLVDSLN